MSTVFRAVRLRGLPLLVVLLLLAGASLGADGQRLPSEGSEAGWYVISFDHRIHQADRDVVVAAGGTGLQYRPSDSYVAWLDDPARLTETAGIAEVRAVAAADKIDPALADAGRLHVTVLVAASTVERAAADIATLGEVAALRPASHGDDMVEVLATVEATAVPAVAELPAVVYVGPAPTGLAPLDEAGSQIVAGNLDGVSVPAGYESWLADRGLDGSGVRVSVVDTGIDPVHPDFGDRLVAKVDYSQSPTGEPIDSGGHGTHVAGIVGGDATGASDAGGPRFTDNEDRLFGLGVAPGVGLVDQNALAVSASALVCGQPLWPPPYPWSRLTSDALDNGATIWNASWHTCEGTGGDYIQTSAAMDALVRDGDPDEAGGQPFTMVFAAGNSGDGGSDDSRVSPVSAAKNVITVAASNNIRAGDPEQIASFSSRGPATDGRWVPHVAAPGAAVASAKALPAGGVCFEPVDGPGAALYSLCSGTSMAAPHVAGAVALATQWWRQQFDADDPSPAMLKALLVNTAHDTHRNQVVPNRHEGWGRIDLGALFDADAERRYLDQSVILDDPGDSHTLQVTPADLTQPLRVTLTWTDAPGAPGAERALVNDLDLTITGPDGTVYHGNVFDAGASLPGGNPDRIDNLENVFLPDADDGTYTITVTADDLPGDGVPDSGDDTDQDFALVVHNAEPSS